MTQKLLIVEDEPKLAELLNDYLTKEGYSVTCFQDGNEVIEWVKQEQPSMILLDLMLPGKDGLTLCKEIRSFSDVPIIMVTAKVEEIDRLVGLEVGADDYICKPFSPREVVARVKTVLRRSPGLSGTQDAEKKLELDESRLMVRYSSVELELTYVEFRLLAQLYSQPGRIFSRDQLINNIYDDHRIVSDRTIDSHIKKLRKKLQQLTNEIEFIRSVYGVGYKYEPQAAGGE